MNIERIVLIVIALSVIITTASAQMHIQVHGGPSFPAEQHISSDEVSSGIKELGFVAGIMAHIPTKKTGLSVVGGFDVLYVELTEERKAYLASRYEFKKYSEHFNIPILIGINYNVPLSNKLDLFGELQGGANIFKVTTTSYIKEEDLTDVVAYKTSTKAAFKTGAGVLIAKKVSLALHYYGLGTHKNKYSEHEDSDIRFSEGEYAYPIKNSAFTVTFGVNF